MEFVDVETAKNARGMRLVVLPGLPSPWSEAAKAIFHVKRIPFVATRLLPGDKTIKAWTRTRNAPVAIHDDEPPRSGWAEILELAERVETRTPLVPAEVDTRIRMFGLAHEIMGEGGLLWTARIATIEASLSSDGARGFPLPVAQFLAPRYGYVAGRSEATRRRVVDGLGALEATLARGRDAGGPYYFGAALTVLDLYSAAAMNLFAPMPDDRCPMSPIFRAGFESAAASLDLELPASLLAHRDLIYEQHLELPIQL